MDFELNEDQRAFADTAAQFAQEKLMPNAAVWDETQFSLLKCSKRPES